MNITLFSATPDVVCSLRESLTRLGIPANHLRAFERENRAHRFDGLFFKARQRCEEARLARSQIGIAVILFAMTVLLYLQIFPLPWVFLGGLGLGLLPFIYRPPSKISKKAYFLVVDVNENERHLVEKLIARQPQVVVQ